MADTKPGAAATSEGAAGTTTGTGTGTTQTPDAKATADKAAADKAAADAAAAAAGKGTGATTEGTTAAATTAKAPDKYALTIPEAGASFLGPDDLAFVEEVARANDWTNEEAQAEIQAHVERATAKETKLAATLLAELTADKDYGGTKLAETQQRARAAIDRIFPAGHRLRDPFLKVFNRGTVGNNLLYVAALAEVGRMMGEDSPAHTRASGAGAKDDVASTLYDHPTSRALDKQT